MRKAGSNENLSGKLRVPLEKHDVLFSKARYVLNQRHIKRPWFNINPFSEKTDEIADLENSLPSESKYTQRLVSLVLCESLHSDHPVHTKELSIEAFFPYLLSGDWEKGCSVRVLEGQLLNELLIGLYRLEKDGVAVRHTTYAFARNNRPRTGCYKLPEKESSGSIVETLMIEFAHFGHLTKDKPNPTTLNPLEYLQYEKSDLIETEEAIDTQLPPLLEEHDKHKDRAMSLSMGYTNGPNKINTKPNRGSCGSLVSKQVQAIGSVEAVQSGKRRQPFADSSIPENRRQSSTKTPLPEGKRQSITTRLPDIRRQTLYGNSPFPENKRHTNIGQSLSPGFRRQLLGVPPFQLNSKLSQEKRRESPDPTLAPQRTYDGNLKYITQNVTQRRFMNKIYSIEFDDDYPAEKAPSKVDVEEVCSPEEHTVFFGEELYLSDQRKKSDRDKSTGKILQQKKIELKGRQEEARRLKKMQSENEKRSRLPILAPVDLGNLKSYQVKYDTIKVPDNVPTLEEFVLLLKADEYNDPRYKNTMSLKRRRIAQGYFRAKDMQKSSDVSSAANLRDETKSITALRNDSRKSLTLPKRKRVTDDIKCKSRMSTLQESTGHETQVPEVNISSSIGSILERAQEVLVVTDSEPCKDHYIKQKRQSSIVPSATPVTKLFPTILKYEDESESPGTYSEESLSDDNSEGFNTKKLNNKYSIERMRKKKGNKIKKKPAFIEVLAKYYNVQNVLRAFRKGSADNESQKARSMARHLDKRLRQEAQNQDEKMVIGKPRKFNFLEVKAKEKLNLDNVSRGDFSAPDLVRFHQQLYEVLDQFVVRREIVVSDIQIFYNATSVTFTKTTCFQHKDRNHRK